MPPDGMSGGGKMEAYLAGIAKRAASAREVRVGFLEGSTYADGTSVPMIAAIQEFGGRVEREPSEVTIYRKIKGDGTFTRNGRFVKKKESNFATTHYVTAHVITIPPRPYFRNMITAHKDEWSGQLGDQLKAADYNATRALRRMGEIIQGELRQSITDLVEPALAASTIAAKGSAKPLIRTGNMRRAVDYEVGDATA